MLRGAHAIALDSKGRLAVPTKYRDWLREESDGQLVCTIDIAHPCLLLYPLPEWEGIEKKLQSLSHMNPVERRLQRLLLGSSCCFFTQALSVALKSIVWRRSAGGTTLMSLRRSGSVVISKRRAPTPEMRRTASTMPA